MLVSDKPTLLIYCQHSIGIGHLIRSFSLAQSLAKTFHVVFLNGGPLPPELAMPRDVEIVNLPSLGLSAGNALYSRNPDYTVEQAKRLRLQFLLTAFERWAPQVVLIELFPFGRKKFAFELLPLLRTAYRRRPRPLILCSLRDLLVTSRKDQQRHDDRARWLIDRYFDAVLMHADPTLVRLEESFTPRKPLQKPLHYTGFVLSGGRRTTNQSCEKRRERRVLVSAGGGSVGAPLLRTAITAYDELWPTARLPMTLVAGPFLAAADWRQLEHEARSRPGLTVYRSIPDLGGAMSRVAASISQCGYNTAMDLIQSGTAALVVPFADGREDEQFNRAQRLEQLGIVRLLPPAQLNSQRLAAEIRALMSFRPNPVSLNLNGATVTAHLVTELAAGAVATGTKR